MMAVLMAACSALTAQAQGVAPAQPRPTVAIIDLSYVFKNYSKFNQATADMKRKVEGADAALVAKKKELDAIAKQAEGMALGSPERNQLEEQYTKLQADIQVEVATQRKEFLRQEAQIYYSVYQEVQDVIKSYCDQQGIVLVMRFNGEPPDPANPQEVMQDLNKAVVYYNRAIDITPAIRDRLEAIAGNAGAGRPAPTTQPGTATRPPRTGNPGVPRPR
jgi:outer membrane protein